MADRHGPLRTGMGQFIASVNGGDIGGGAIVAPLDSDAWGEYTVDMEADVAAIVPAGARGGEGISPEDVMILTGGSEEVGSEITYNLESSGALVPVGSWIPPTTWNPSDPYEANWYWSSNNPYEDDYFWTPNNPGDIGVLVPNIEAVIERIGIGGVFWDELPEDAEMVEEGDTVEAENLGVAMFGDEELYPGGTYITDSSGSSFLPEEPIFSSETTDSASSQGTLFDDMSTAGHAFDAGAQAPIGGAGFGMGVLSTPSAEVAGQNANPLTAVSTQDLLTREETSNLLSNAGVSDAESVEWAAEPSPVSAESDYEQPTLLGADAELELFAGVASGGDAPWGVTLGVARATPDDHVIAIGLNRRPVGTADAGQSAVENDQHVVDNMAAMMAETVPELQSG